MRKLNHFVVTTGISALFIFLLPCISNAQTVAEDSAFTRDALAIGFLVLSIIILVFLGLMLKARVNELQSFLRKDVHENHVTNRRQKLMSLDEEEIAYLQEKRLQKHRLEHTSPTVLK